MPTLTTAIVSACTRKHQEKMKKKTMQAITPGITTAIGKCVGIYSKRMSAMKCYYGLTLSNAGVTDNGLDRMAHLQDSVIHNTVDKKLTDLANRYDELLKKWDQQLVEYGIVIDNVDIMTRPRRQKEGKSNVMHHMIQGIAVQERVSTAPQEIQQTMSVEDVKPEDIYPTEAEHQQLRDKMVSEVIRIWSNLPALKEVPVTLRPETHTHTAEMTRKSEYVSEPILHYIQTSIIGFF